MIDGIGQLTAGGDELEKGTGTLVSGAGELLRAAKLLPEEHPNLLPERKN